MVAADRGRPGKIASLRAFLEDHAEAVEADLQHYFEEDLRDLWRGDLSYRRLGVLIRHLPQDSWTQTILRDEQLTELVNPQEEPAEPTFGPWSLLNYQLASLTDAVNQLRHVTAIAGGLKGPNKSDPVPPEPTPRPGLKRGAQQRRNPEAVVLYLDRLRAKG